eukprot:2283340-Pyramimonas_sp.AAC.1
MRRASPNRPKALQGDGVAMVTQTETAAGGPMIETTPYGDLLMPTQWALIGEVMQSMKSWICSIYRAFRLSENGGSIASEL